MKGTFSARSLPTDKTKRYKRACQSTAPEYTRQSFSETTSLRPDNFKISLKPNTDGVI
jgi:hypothetical protein